MPDRIAIRETAHFPLPKYDNNAIIWLLPNPILVTERGDGCMIGAFVASVMAGVVANMISYYLCKWLDGKRNGN
jgi:hypothetical protein